MSLEQDFQSATERVKQLRETPSNDVLLELYGLYKQATEGDVTEKQPSRLNLRARAKWDAWNARKGLERDEARRRYIDLVDRLTRS